MCACACSRVSVRVRTCGERAAQRRLWAAEASARANESSCLSPKARPTPNGRRSPRTRPTPTPLHAVVLAEAAGFRAPVPCARPPCLAWSLPINETPLNSDPFIGLSIPFQISWRQVLGVQCRLPPLLPPPLKGKEIIERLRSDQRWKSPIRWPRRSPARHIAVVSDVVFMSVSFLLLSV